MSATDQDDEEDHVYGARLLFQRLSNEHGSLTKSILRELVAKVTGRGEEEQEKIVAALFTSMDADNDGSIDESEFVASMTNNPKWMMSFFGDPLDELFSIYADADDSMSIDVLKEQLSQIGAPVESVDDWFASLDKDQSGTIELHEFKQAWHDRPDVMSMVFPEIEVKPLSPIKRSTPIITEHDLELGSIQELPNVDHFSPTHSFSRRRGSFKRSESSRRLPRSPGSSPPGSFKGRKLARSPVAGGIRSSPSARKRKKNLPKLTPRKRLSAISSEKKKYLESIFDHATHGRSQMCSDDLVSTFEDPHIGGELAKSLKQLAAKDQLTFYKELFKRLDLDGDGELDRDEFVVAFAEMVGDDLQVEAPGLTAHALAALNELFQKVHNDFSDYKDETEAKLKQANNRTETINTMYEDALEENEKSEKEVDRLQEENVALKKDVKDLRGQVDAFSTKVDDLDKQHIHDFEKEQEESEKILSLQAILKAKTAEYDELNKEMNIQAEEIAELERKLKEHEDLVSDMRYSLSSMSGFGGETISPRMSEFSESDPSALSKSGTAMSIELQVAMLIQEREVCLKVATDLADEVNTICNAELRPALGGEEKIPPAAINGIDPQHLAEQAVCNLQAEVEELLGVGRALASACTNASHERVNQHSIIEEQRNKLQNLEREFDALKTKLETQGSDFDQERERLERELAETKSNETSSAHDAVAKILQLETDKTGLQSALDKVQADLSDALLKLAEVLKLRDDSLERVKELEQAHAVATAELSDLNKAAGKREREVHLAEGKLADAERALAQAQSEIEILNSKLNELKRLLDQANAELYTSNTVQTNLQEQLQEAKFREDELNKKLASSDRELRECNTQLKNARAAMKELNENLESKEKKTAAEVKILESQLRTLEKERAVLTQELDAQKSSAEKILAELQALKGASSRTNEANTTEIKELQDALSASQKKVDETMSDLELSKAHAEKTEVELDKSSKQLIEARKQLGIFEAERESLFKAASERAAKMADAENRCYDLEAQVNALTDETTAQEKRLQEAIEQAIEAKKLIEAANQQVKELEGKLATMSSQARQTDTKSAAEITQLREATQALQADLAAARNREQIAHSQLEMSQRSISSLEADVARSKQSQDDMMAELVKAKASLANALTNVKKSGEEVASLTSQLVAKDAEMASITSLAADSQTSANEAREKAAALALRVASMEENGIALARAVAKASSLEDALGVSNKMIEDLKLQLRRAEGKCNELEVQLEKARAATAAAQRDGEIEARDHERTSRTIGELSEAAKAAGERVKQLEHANAELKAQKAVLELSAKASENQIADQSAKISDLESVIKHSQDQASEAEKQLKELRQREHDAALQAIKRDADAKLGLRAVEANLATCSDKIQSLENALGEAKKREQELRERMQSREAELARERSDSFAAISRQATESESRSQQLMAQKSSLGVGLASLRQIAEAIKPKISTFNAMGSELTSFIHTLTSKLGKAHGQHQSISSTTGKNLLKTKRLHGELNDILRRHAEVRGADSLSEVVEDMNALTTALESVESIERSLNANTVQIPSSIVASEDETLPHNVPSNEEDMVARVQALRNKVLTLSEEFESDLTRDRTLQDRFNKAQTIYEACTNQVSALIQRISSLSTEFDVLSTAIKDIEKLVEKSEDGVQLAVTGAKVDNLRHRLNSIEIRAAEIDGGGRGASEEISRLSTLLDDLNVENDKIMSTAHQGTFETIEKDVAMTLVEKTEALNKDRKQFASLRRRVKDQQNVLNAALRRLESLAGSANRPQSESSSSLESLQRMLVALREELASTTGKNVNETNAVRDLLAARDRELAEAQEALRNASIDIEQLVRDRDAAKRSAEDISAKSRLEAEKTDSAVAFERDATRASNLRADAVSAKLADAEQQISVLLTKQNADQVEIQRLQVALSQSQEDVRRIQDQLTRIRNEHETSAARTAVQLSAAQDASRIAQDTITRLEHENSTTTAALDRAMAASKDARRELDSVQFDHSILVKRVTELESELSKRTGELSSLREQLSGAQQEVVNSRREIASSASQRDSALQQLSSKETEVQLLQAERDRAVADIETAHTNTRRAKQDAKAEISSLSDELNRIRAQQSTDKAASRNEIDQLQQRLSNQRAEVERSNALRIDMAREMERSKSALAAAHSRLSDLEAELIATDEKRSKLLSDLKVAQDEAASKATLMLKISHLESEIARLNGAKNLAEQRLAVSESQNADARNRLNDAYRNAEQLHQNIDSSHKVQSHSSPVVDSSKLRTVEAAAHAAEVKIEAFKQKLVEKDAEHASEIAELQSRLTKADAAFKAASNSAKDDRRRAASLASLLEQQQRDYEAAAVRIASAQRERDEAEKRAQHLAEQVAAFEGSENDIPSFPSGGKPKQMEDSSVELRELAVTLARLEAQLQASTNASDNNSMSSAELVLHGQLDELKLRVQQVQDKNTAVEMQLDHERRMGVVRLSAKEEKISQLEGEITKLRTQVENSAALVDDAENRASAANTRYAYLEKVASEQATARKVSVSTKGVTLPKYPSDDEEHLYEELEGRLSDFELGGRQRLSALSAGGATSHNSSTSTSPLDGGAASQEASTAKLQLCVRLLVAELQRLRGLLQDQDAIEAWRNTISDENKQLWTVIAKICKTNNAKLENYRDVNDTPRAVWGKHPKSRQVLHIHDALVGNSRLATKLDLPGKIDLEIDTTRRVTLLDSERRIRGSWPFGHIKRFGIDGDIFSIEIGHESSTPGVLYFWAGAQARRLFQTMDAVRFAPSQSPIRA